MLDELRKKSYELACNVFELAIASKTRDENSDVEIDSELTESIDIVTSKIAVLTNEVKQLDAMSTPNMARLMSTPRMSGFKTTLERIVDETEDLCNEVMKMPRPKNRVGRPKYDQRLHRLYNDITAIVGIVVRLRNHFPFDGTPTDPASRETRNGRPDKRKKRDEEPV